MMADLHPMIGDRWEQDRCPICGDIGVEIGWNGPLTVMACPTCEPERIPYG